MTADDLSAVLALPVSELSSVAPSWPGAPLDRRYAARFAARLDLAGRLPLAVDGLALGCLQLNSLFGMTHAVPEARATWFRTLQLTTGLEREWAHIFYVVLGFGQSHAGLSVRCSKPVIPAHGRRAIAGSRSNQKETFA